MLKSCAVMSIVGIAAVAVCAQAQQPEQLPNVFDCRIRQYFTQDDNGTLTDRLPKPLTKFVEDIKGASILVERRTGKLLTKAPAIWAHTHDKASVLELGDQMQSYKATFQTTSGYLAFAYLTISTFAPGPEKPFILIDGASVYAGTCR